MMSLMFVLLLQGCTQADSNLSLDVPTAKIEATVNSDI